MISLPAQLKSPTFWASLAAGITAVAAGLTDTGNPTLIAIGGAIVAVHAIGESIVQAFAELKKGDVNTALQQSSALVPVLEKQIVSVQNLAHTIGQKIEVEAYKARGYEVTPAPSTVPVSEKTSVTFAPAPVTAPSASSAPASNAPGGAHEVIGVPKP